MNEQQRRQLFLQEIGISTEWVRRTPVTAPALNESHTTALAAAPSIDPSEYVSSATESQAPSPQNVEESFSPPTKVEQPHLELRQTSPLPPSNESVWLGDSPFPESAMPPTQEILQTHELKPHNQAVAAMDWDSLENTVSACTRCGLCSTRTQTVFGVGNRAAEQLIVGEAAGEQEDKQGQPFVGQAGKLLDNMLHAIGLGRTKNVYIANVLKCRPPGNRDPHPEEVMQCSPYLHRQIDLLKPKRILVVGRFAAQTLLNTDTAIGKLRGRQHSYQGIPVVVTYHPAYLLRSPLEKAKAWTDLCDFMR